MPPKHAHRHLRAAAAPKLRAAMKQKRHYTRRGRLEQQLEKLQAVVVVKKRESNKANIAKKNRTLVRTVKKAVGKSSKGRVTRGEEKAIDRAAARARAAASPDEPMVTLELNKYAAPLPEPMARKHEHDDKHYMSRNGRIAASNMEPIERPVVFAIQKSKPKKPVTAPKKVVVKVETLPVVELASPRTPKVTILSTRPLRPDGQDVGEQRQYTDAFGVPASIEETESISLPYGRTHTSGHEGKSQMYDEPIRTMRQRHTIEAYPVAPQYDWTE